MKKSFIAFEYHQDEKFYSANYQYEGSAETGWVISRNQSHYLTLPRGYQLLKTLACGICSTDIARHHLPFPLPQITGHEVVALYNDKMVVVDINAAHKHLGDKTDCIYCDNDLENHCPDRLTLGIDRLPGGFAPFILVPQHAIIPLPENFNLKLASITEPFAAALHAVETENIQEGDSVAIVGPRRLGSLLILALKLWREKQNINFEIIAIVRSDKTKKLCLLAGADEVVNTNQVLIKNYIRNYHVVFDTSGSLSGFELALSIANRTVHVKSTNGKAVLGLQYLTEMVIDELSLLSIKKENVNQYLSSFNGENIVVDSRLGNDIFDSIENKSLVFISENDLDNAVDRADLIIATSMSFVNKAVRNENGKSSLQPKGTLLLVSVADSNLFLEKVLSEGVRINTSRCGDFYSAINLLSSNSKKTNNFLLEFISETYSVEQLPEAFENAKNNKSSIKVLVEHGGGFSINMY